MKGIVIKSTGSWYNVKLENGSTIEARIQGKFRLKGIRSTNPVAVGDIVTIKQEEGASVITEIADRRNYIVRKSINLSKRSHIIAANVDQAILIVTISQPKTTSGFMDRFLVSAEAYHIPTIIVFNKTDIYTPEELSELENLMAIYTSIGYKCLSVSATEGTNLEQLKTVLKNRTSVISGHSGVGKSTLLNKLEPTLNLKTSEISEMHEQGKHTTTFAEMFDLSFGGHLIDTPGVKAFGLIDFDKSDLSHYFLEMRAILDNCQFNNCQHINEPKCAVKDAVVKNEIADFRYNNYLSMYNDDEEENYRAKGY
ncbi:MAG: ribosome small subunit-dependent GTPase A [Flavobacteriales bacterium]|nr:MAG: ribosome small subunit-dependent GTPase A [Flavobacteriales bacterium]